MIHYPVLVCMTSRAYPKAIPDDAWSVFGRATTLRGLVRLLKKADRIANPAVVPSIWKGHVRAVDVRDQDVFDEALDEYYGSQGARP